MIGRKKDTPAVHAIGRGVFAELKRRHVILVFQESRMAGHGVNFENRAVSCVILVGKYLENPMGFIWFRKNWEKLIVLLWGESGSLVLA